MGEVGTNSADNPHVDLKMNGGINGSCDDERNTMEIDTSNTSNETIAKNADSSVVQTTADSNEMDLDSGGDLDNVSKAPCDVNTNVEISEHEQKSDQNQDNAESHENGATESTDALESKKASDHKQGDDVEDDHENADCVMEKNEIICDEDMSSKLIDENDSMVKVLSDPLSMDVEFIDEEKRTNHNRPLSTENGTSATVTSSSNDEYVGKKQPIKQPIPIDDEIHAISDSDDEDVHIKPMENPLKGIDDHTMDVTNSNGLRANDVINNVDDDDDKPVSIHSDSDDSDKEDCVVIEDDKKDDTPSARLTTPNRNRKSAMRPRDDLSYDDDIEEIIEDPLEQSAPKRPRLIDPLASESLSKQQTTMANANTSSKEPTLVIIDTNTILSRGAGSTGPAVNKANVSVTPVGMPVHGVYPNPNASITSIPNNGNNNALITNATSTTLAGLNAPVLTALTDDMFVLEAPSFIVPYIYEKPPTEDLKEIVMKMGVDLEEQRKKEEQLKKEQQETDEKEPIEDAKDEEKSEHDETSEKKPAKKRKTVKNADDSWDESDESSDDDADSDIEEIKVLIKEAKADLDTIKTHIINRDMTSEPITDDKKDGYNYFDSPLGKFFMDIGINLVQEHVQTDLLRQQKRKLNREGNQASPSVQVAINSLMKNLELSKGKNDVFKFETKRCEYCNFKSESSLVMAHHYETPHMKGNLYKCNFCEYEVKPPYDILLHMKTVHNIQARLEKAASYHQCPNCLFEDNGRSKLARHAVVCSKKFRPELNLAPPVDWDPPAKIPRIKPRHGLVGTANAYQAMAAQAQRAATAAAIQRQTAINVNAVKNRGRPQTISKVMPAINNNIRPTQPANMRPSMTGGVVLPNNFQVTNPGQYIQVPGTGIALMPSAQNSFNLVQPTGSKTPKSSQQPSISITALPRQNQPGALPGAQAMQSASLLPKPSGTNVKPGQVHGSKASFVICEICDGWIKDLDQLRNHMQWMHKVKIHPKMIYNRPPLNCQKCQFRFFTDQGLERHLLGSHGLVTSSMQEAANKSKDAGRCPVCGRMYQWKLLNHVSREHGMTLKPAHLSYKCTVCTATFGMYKQFESHVYSAHSTVTKKSNDNKTKSASTSSGSSASNNSRSNITSSSGGASILKQPFKINDEITITPQPALRNNRTSDIESHVID